MKFLIVFAAVLGVAYGQLVVAGSCKQVSLQKDFDVPRYTGKWYEIYRYEHTNQLGGDCATANYTLVNGTVNVLNEMVAGPILTRIRGTVAPAPDANGEGKLLVNFPTTGNLYSDYWVLSTDYSDYSLVYACTDLPNNNRRISSWVLSRQSILSIPAVMAITPIIEAVDGLNWESYRLTSHSAESCNYTNITEISQPNAYLY